MLIVTLPPAYGGKNEALIGRIAGHPLVGAMRYNAGIDSPYTAEETLARVLKRTSPHGKPLYLDVKGRQLRIREWATMPYGPCVLNHNVRVTLPATVMFRGDDACEIVEVVDGNKLYVEPLPKYPVGRGQSVNIISPDLRIEENFTDSDYDYVEAAVKLGINKFMLSYVEDIDYVAEFGGMLGDCGAKFPDDTREVVLKIESRRGVEYVQKTDKSLIPDCRLMAARDDLMNEIGVIEMLPALKDIIAGDANAICASRLLAGLEQNGRISMGDLSDLTLMRQLGYKHFMLSDGISKNHFDAAIRFWEAYTRG